MLRPAMLRHSPVCTRLLCAQPNDACAYCNGSSPCARPPQVLAQTPTPCYQYDVYSNDPADSAGQVSAGSSSNPELTQDISYAYPCNLTVQIPKDRKWVAYQVQMSYSYFKPDQVASKCANSGSCTDYQA